MKTLQELKDEFAQLAEVVAVASARRQEIHADIVSRERKASAAVILRKLSNDEKDSLRDALKESP